LGVADVPSRVAGRNANTIYRRARFQQRDVL